MSPDTAQKTERRELLRFITCGSVDDGKSTLIGRLLYESRGIYADQLSAVRRASSKRGTGALDLSLVTDGLRAEREQGITIDVARRYFSTPRRKFIISDTPGHEQYTRNMATGASTAELAVILLDASRGVTAQSHRHAFISVLLGIPHLVVTVNKMDLVGYSQEVFEHVRDEFAAFAARLEARDLTFIPVSALAGDNVVTRSGNMPWYQGTTLLNHLETVHIASDRNFIDLRLPVQYVARSDAGLDGKKAMFRGYMGTVASGVVRPGDELTVLPAGLHARVEQVLGPDGPIDEGFPPLGVCVTLTGEQDVSRGDMLVHVHNLPHVGSTFEAMLLWIGEEPLAPGREYLIRHTTRTVPGTVTELRYRVDVSTLHRQEAATLGLNEIGRAVVGLKQPVCYDPYAKNRATGSFVVIDRVTNNTVGAGMILDREPEELLHTTARWTARPRGELHTHEGLVRPEQRAERMGHKPVTVWLTGLTGSGKSTLAYALEKRLFDEGRASFVLDGENVRTSFGRDLDFSAADRSENVRRAAEVARLFNEAGLIAICAFISPYEADRQKARQTVGLDRFVEVYLSAPADLCRRRQPGIYEKADRGEIRAFSGVSAPYEPPGSPELALPTGELGVEACVERIVELLKARGFIR
jgi:bifunctional enzyme CysN/CysC